MRIREDVTMPESLQDTLEFLRDLRAHNERQWFEQYRPRYDLARAHFEAFVTDLIVSIGAVDDLTGVTARECIFRINRDVRFSPDKSPYKTHMSAVIGKGGRKASGRAYYVHIEPGGRSMVAGGLHSPTAPELDRVRRRIADDAAKLKRVINRRDFKRHFGSLQGDALKTAPLGYAKNHPDIELLRLKQYLAVHILSDEQVLAPDLTTHVVDVCRALKPFLTYLQSALDA